MGTMPMSERQRISRLGLATFVYVFGAGFLTVPPIEEAPQVLSEPHVMLVRPGDSPNRAPVHAPSSDMGENPECWILIDGEKAPCEK